MILNKYDENVFDPLYTSASINEYGFPDNEKPCVKMDVGLRLKVSNITVGGVVTPVNGLRCEIQSSNLKYLKSSDYSYPTPVTADDSKILFDWDFIKLPFDVVSVEIRHDYDPTFALDGEGNQIVKKLTVKCYDALGNLFASGVSAGGNVDGGGRYIILSSVAGFLPIITQVAKVYLRPLGYFTDFDNSDGMNGLDTYTIYDINLSATNSWTNCTMMTTVVGVDAGFTDIPTDQDFLETKYWNILTDLSPAGEDVNSDYLVWFKPTCKDITGYTYSTIFTFFPSIVTVPVFIQKPIFDHGTISEYTNLFSYPFSIVLDNASSAFATKNLKFYSNLLGFSAGSTGDISRWTSVVKTNTEIKCEANFSGQLPGEKTVFVQICDEFFNKSDVVSFTINFNNVVPFDLYIKVFGTQNNAKYTGILIDDNGGFVFDNSINIQIFGDSALPLSYNISGNVISDPANGIGTTNGLLNYHAYTNGQSTIINAKLAPHNNLYMGVDTLYTITLNLKDAAGNTSSANYQIRYNTKLFKTKNKNLRPPTSSYDHVVMDIDGVNTFVINRQYTDTVTFKRSWEDIFYPETHSYPVTVDGVIDIEAAIAMQETSTNTNDAVQLNSTKDALALDSENRPVTIDWKKDGTKNYANLSSAYDQEIKAWVIDNTGFGEIQLEFEYFDLDTGNYGPPFNSMSPHPGDCVVIYDCSDPSAVTPYYDKLGNVKYNLNGTSYLGEELDAFQGSGSKVYSYYTGLMGSTAEGAFKTQIYQTSRICVVFYSDVAGSASGFKIKASPKRDDTWENWNIDENNGLVWIHQYDADVNNIGKSGTDNVRVIYDYYNTDYFIDYEKGEVYFSDDLGETITAYYTYYDYGVNENPPSLTFASYQDDIVEYAPLSIWFSTYGKEIIKTAQSYPVPNYPVNVNEPTGYEALPNVFYNGTVADSKFTITTALVGGAAVNLVSGTLDNCDVYFSTDNVTYPIHGIIISNIGNELTVLLDDGASLAGCLYAKVIIGWNGKLTSKYTINKDCGYVTFNSDNSVAFNNTFAFAPRGRIFMDYQYHSFLRLTNDGYGDCTFHNDILVPDTTTKYPDYTWTDVKLVNEGNESLERGKMKFLSRGISDPATGVVTQVLNFERPWDVQLGAADETYGKAAVLWSKNYTFPSTCTRTVAQSIFNQSYTVVAGVSSVGTAPLFPDTIDPKGVIYGRIVWTLAGSGTNYPVAPTSGKKCFASEIEGSYYSLE